MPKQDRARRTHEVLLDAAAGEFARHGYAGANLERIAVHVGMTKGALYAHFPSKEALAAALTTPFEQTWRTILQQTDEAGGDALGALQCIAFSLARRLSVDIRFRAGLQLESEEARARGEVPAVVGDMTRVAIRLARQAQQRGELKSAYTPEALSSLLAASTFGMYHTMSLHRLDTIPHEARRIWQLLFSAPARCPAGAAPTAGDAPDGAARAAGSAEVG
ncbi:helix-turn-helix domain-containing protein [Streptomyces sp. NPDC046324]|uniref:helix-turn-helix domain-containing protein n=1 Tax=Streptomyces sp. NPDC046324 TaxID=3154915 RepID=UPI0033C1BC2B